MTRRLVVSDIHGEGHRLLKVLEKAKYAPGVDRVFLLGDYIDRGTDAKFTVQVVMDLVKGGAIALKGNHDVMPKGAASDPAAYAFWVQHNGGGETTDSFGGIPPENIIEWLDGLPLYHEEPDCIMVHAGLNPAAPLEVQDPQDLLWIRGEFINYYRGKRVIFGHTPTPNIHGLWEPWYGPDKVGIDTGAAYGGPLTLLDIDSGEKWTA